MESGDGKVVGGEHAADLVVAAFEEADGCGARAGEGEGGGAAGFGFAVEEERAGGEDRDESWWDVSVDGDLVGFGGFVAWGGPAVDVGAVVGEEDEPAGFLIETADGFGWRLAAHPCGWEDVVDERGLGGVVGAGDAGGFMVGEEHARGEFEGFAVDEDGDWVDAFFGTVDDDACGGEALGVEPGGGFAAAAEAETGEQLIGTEHGHVIAWHGKFALSSRASVLQDWGNAAIFIS